MELDRSLINLQGTLYSYSMQGLLNKPDTLHQVLKGMREVIDNISDCDKSKVAFLLVLSTRTSILDKLKHDKFVGHYINAEPYLEKEYLIIYIYHLRLQTELFRVIENCPGSLGLELLEQIIKDLKDPDFCKVEFGCEHFYQLWQSIFIKLCKLVTKLHVEDTTDKFVTCFLDVYGLIEEVIVTSMKDNAEFDGLQLYYFFKTLLFCIKQQKTPDVSDDPLYELSTEFRFNRDSVCYNAMTNCLNKVFWKIPNILQSLTVDMWIFFSECYCSADSKNSVQLLIGDLVFNILKEVKDGEKHNVHSHVLSILSSIAVNKLDLMAKAGIDEIISNIKNGEKEWFKALVRHSAFTTKESLECLIDYLELADSDDLNMILNTSYDCLCGIENVNLDVIRKLFLTSLKQTPNYEQWLTKIFDKLANEPSLLTTDETQEELIQTFNKISNGKNIPHSDLILLCVQSPLDTIKKICQIAVYGSAQTKFVTEILKLLKYPLNMPHWGGFTLLDYVVLKSLLEDLTPKEKQSFISMIVQLGKENILSASFQNNLLKCLKGYLEDGLLDKAVLCLEIVKAVLELKIFELHKAGFLVYLCQVLGHFSWDLRSFSVIKADGREQVDDIITSVINELEENENVPDIQWTRQEIVKSWEANQVYFCDLWFKFNASWSGSGTFHSLILALAHSHHKSHDLRNVLINFDQPFEIRASVIVSLTTLLPVFTFPRWNSIFHELIIAWRNINSEEQDVYYDVLDMFGSSILLLSMNLNQEEDMFPCYKYCLRNYGKLAKQSCPKMSEISLVRTFQKIFLFLGEIEDGEKRKSCWEIFPPLLMELVERLRKKNAAEAHRREIEELLPLLDLKDIAKGLLKKLH